MLMLVLLWITIHLIPSTLREAWAPLPARPATEQEPAYTNPLS